jgi:hypothetical protein
MAPMAVGEFGPGAGAVVQARQGRLFSPESHRASCRSKPGADRQNTRDQLADTHVAASLSCNSASSCFPRRASIFSKKMAPAVAIEIS